MKKFNAHIAKGQQPVRIDATTIEKAREIAEQITGWVGEVYQLFDWVESPAMFSESNEVVVM